MKGCVVKGCGERECEEGALGFIGGGGGDGQCEGGGGEGG